MKCTLCYDRMQNGMVPACAQACPTASIQFGPIAELRERGAARVEQLNAQSRDAGRPEDAYLYGADESIVGGLNSFYLLVDEPEVYGLPRAPKLPSQHLPESTALTVAGAAGLGLLGLLGFRKRRMDEFAAEAGARVDGGGAESVRLAPGETVIVEPATGPDGEGGDRRG